MGLAFVVALLVAAELFHVGRGYQLAVLAGCVLGFAGGFCGFSRGGFFQRNRRGAFLSVVFHLLSIFLAIELGFSYGFWWGAGAFLAFWPTSSGLALQFMTWKGWPVDLS